MRPSPPELILRLACFGIFAGHGAFALEAHAPWLRFFPAVGLELGFGRAIMPWIGGLDVALAILVLFRPIPAALVWMSFWALWTAALRPLAGDSLFAFVERSGNFGAPLALLLLRGLPSGARDWLR